MQPQFAACVSSDPSCISVGTSHDIFRRGMPWFLAQQNGCDVSVELLHYDYANEPSRSQNTSATIFLHLTYVPLHEHVKCLSL